MISAWYKHIDGAEEQDRFKSAVQGSKIVLDRLQELLNEMKIDVEATELNTKIYDIPNWDYRQADTNGFKRALKLVSKLVNLDPQENK